jgi:hypothetical protein
LPELVSLLKKYVSARPTDQECPKTRPKHYENGVFGPWIGGRRGREGVFNRLTS